MDRTEREHVPDSIIRSYEWEILFEDSSKDKPQPTCLMPTEHSNPASHGATHTLTES